MNRLALLFFCFIITNGALTAQNHDKESYPPVNTSDTSKVYTITEVSPEFPGGETAMNQFLIKNIRYPQMAKDNNISGKVLVGFIVDAQGYVKDVKLIRGIGSGCDEEAIRVIKNMPQWTPGKQGGKPVKVMFTIPISFTMK